MKPMPVLLLLLLISPLPAGAQEAPPAEVPRISLDLRATPTGPTPPPSPRAARLRRDVLFSMRAGAAATLLGILLLIRRQRRAFAAEGAVLAPFFPEQASSYAGEVDHLYIFLTAVSVTISALVAFLLIYFAIKYRRRPDRQVGEPQGHTTRHEITWISVLFVIALIMFGWGARVFLRQYTPSRDDLVIYVVGKQWMWKFQHPGGQMEINELHVPAGRDVKLIMATRDVIHSLYVPAFRVKMDAVPGRYRTFWFRAIRTGRYHLFCAEYCGTNHSGMTGWVTVMEPAAYAAFLSTGRITRSLAWEGERLFQDLACQSCHRGDTQGRGPRLEGVYGRPVLLRDGSSVIADDNYLRESIVNPAARIVAGFEPIMPTFQGQLSEEQLLALVAYIKSLGPPVPAAQPGALQPGDRYLAPTLPVNPDAQRSNPVGATPPRTVPLPPFLGETQP